MAGIRHIKSLSPVYYGTGSTILKDFLVPVLSESSAYDRITGYFTVEALLAVAQGLDRLYSNKGRMRLAVGLHAFPAEAAQAVVDADSLHKRIAHVRRGLVEGITKISESLLKDRLATLALMIEDGFLEVKAIGTETGRGIFHSKLLILSDDSGDTVAAMGSINETASGLGDNFENLVVLCSWENAEGVKKQCDIFNKTWKGTYPGIITYDLTRELAQDIIEGLGKAYVENLRQKYHQKAALADAAKMPSYFFVSGVIPALFQHQERAVIDGLSRWPVRVLYSDEVGLGKTYEVAATLAYLNRYCGARRIVILTPKSVLTQWQEELYDGFGIEAWRYDSASMCFISPHKATRQVRDNCPLGKDMPSIVLISAQYARGTNGQEDIFNRKGTILPDVLALDEAHAARVSMDVSNKKKSTRLFRSLKSVAPRIPHLILATATPMQKDAIEYHSLLSLLGLPNYWSREKAFELSLSVAAAHEAPAINSLAQATMLLLETIEEMHPPLHSLNDDERILLGELHSQANNLAMGVVAQSHWEVFRSLFVKLHPARLLTVRNTRKSLESIGYVFPRRRLSAVTLFGHNNVLAFYDAVSAYVNSTYLGVEKVLYPDRKFSDGFVKSSYRQRMASSLYACGKSLERRMVKLKNLKRAIEAKNPSKWSLETELTAEDEDDGLVKGIELEDYYSALKEIDSSQVLLAINTELLDISPLVKRQKQVSKVSGDPKVDRSIDIALEHINDEDQVLVFSRYTDTVEALLRRWRTIASPSIAYGLYTGQQALLVQGQHERKTTKEEIKELLNAGTLKIMFCSDAASEGLNLQAARVLINVDVPWTPARLEQRIGRIARLGQKAPSVDIINVWYPRSVEERMYTRINQRLQSYNLTVGEFPEVVADSIRQSILDESLDDNSTKLLQEIRNSLQIKALKVLWDSTQNGRSSSRKFREGLIKDVVAVSTFERLDSNTIRVELDDGSTEIVTSQEGNTNTIALNSRCVIEHFPYVHGYRMVRDADGRSCAYASQKEVLDPERLPDCLLGVDNDNSPDKRTRPKWLPDVSGMDLGYAVEYQSFAPRYWPPDTGESI